MANLFQTVLITPILNLLMFFYYGLNTLGIPYAFGFAIMLLTASIRLLTSPLIHAQMHSAHKMSKLKPHLDELSKKHKDDKEQLSKEQMRLYKEAGVNPLGGCLPLLFQLPIFIALFQVFSRTLGGGNGQGALDVLNKSLYVPWLKVSGLDLTFFGLSLTVKPSQWQSEGFLLLVIPVVTALLQFVQTKQMMVHTVSKPKKEGQEEDTATAVQKQMAFVSPFMFGMISYSFPIGLALYWNIFTVFGILQQYFFNKKQDGTKNN